MLWTELSVTPRGSLPKVRRRFIRNVVSSVSAVALLLESVHAGNAWFIEIRKDSLTFNVVELLDNGAPATVRLTVTSLHAFPHAPYLLSATDSGVFVSERGYPFESTLIKLTGTNKIALRPASSSAVVAATRANSRQWLALTVLELDRGFVQVLANTQSDIRLIITYDEAGNVLQARTLDAPVGFFAVARQAHLIAGLLAAGTPAVQVFHWTWTNSSTLGGAP